VRLIARVWRSTRSGVDVFALLANGGLAAPGGPEGQAQAKRLAVPPKDRQLGAITDKRRRYVADRMKRLKGEVNAMEYCSAD
jgi:hypothetical protein